LLFSCVSFLIKVAKKNEANELNAILVIMVVTKGGAFWRLWALFWRDSEYDYD